MEWFVVVNLIIKASEAHKEIFDVVRYDKTINLIGNILNNENAIIIEVYMIVAFSSKLCCCIQQADECYRSRDECHSSQYGRDTLRTETKN